MKSRKKINQIRLRRKLRVRSNIFGTSLRPRLSVFRSHKFTSVQLIDDENHKTLAVASSSDLKKKIKKTEAASEVGKIIGEKAKALGIEKAVFDRGAYRYHGRVKALVEATRKHGLLL
ncbi:MAG: 50S ribosomal protein L18 [Patescibacteria group bacterium]|nr:50S ribosomal protein L18 [Patescibacteria group bacterium]